MFLCILKLLIVNSYFLGLDDKALSLLRVLFSPYIDIYNCIYC